MDINSYKFLELDELEIQKAEEEQHKEIKALLASEFDCFELEDEDEEEVTNSCSPDHETQEDSNLIDEVSIYDKENVFNDSHCSPEQATPWVSHPLAAFYPAPQTHNLNYLNYHQVQTNNNCQREDVSINWDVSLHGEMGIPISRSNKQFYSDKIAYMATSNITTKDPPRIANMKNKSPIKVPPSPMKIIKRDVAVECIPVNQRELDNLELLYAARGRRIEQLQTELDSEKEKRLKEIRVLNHKVTLLESEQRNESNLLKSYKIEINDQRQNLSEKEKIIEFQAAKLTEMEGQVEKLTLTVEARSSLVESLNLQLSELKSSSSMSRNDKKHDDLLECINYQFDTDAHRFQTEISRLSERLDDKIKEIQRLQVQLDEQVTFYQSQKKLWSEEKEQMIDNLNEEKKCRLQCEKSVNQEMVNRLKCEVSDLTMGKSMVEDTNFYLQEEVVELTNQLLAYEETLSLLENRDSTKDNNFVVNNSAETLKSRTQSVPSLLNVNDMYEMKSNGLHGTFSMRKELFSLTSRTHLLTNRLIDVRKDNLELKTNMMKLQKIIVEQNEVLFVLEEKFSASESRLGQLQSGNETDIEKQLRNSNESLEVIKKSLELQCNELLSQLKYANNRMEEIEILRRQSEKEFNELKEVMEEDKLSEIEEVKRACSIHFDNLRQQMEMSWMSEKDAFIIEERRLRDELQHELSDALLEVDRVKNLYIQFSQQRSAEESNLTNWNEWLTKKLDEQKRSLNQQFQNDLHSKIMEINAQNDAIIKKLVSDHERHRPTEHKSTCTELTTMTIGLQYAGDMTNESCQTLDVIKRESSVQTNETMQSLQEMENLVQTNRRLESTVTSLKCQINQDCRCDNGNLSSSNSISSLETSRSDNLLPHIIRSSTPQFVHSSHNITGYDTSTSTHASLAGLKTIFRSLKDDLVSQLMEISRSVTHKDNGIKSFRPVSFSSMEPLDAFDRIKEQLYNYILQMQVRAASTMQQELHNSHKRIRCDLLQQLRQILPLTLSVDGQLINVAPDKMRVLTDKVTLILDRMHSDEYSPSSMLPSSNKVSHTHYSNPSPRLSRTSTPINVQRHNRNNEDKQSDATSISSENSLNVLSEIIDQTCHGVDSAALLNDTVIRTRCEQLQDEILKLNDDLQRTKQSCDRSQSLFDNVDHNWLYDQ